jgi:GntR family transcriptional regulator / MocR family aminotransferase
MAMVRFTGADGRSSFEALDETSQPLELLLSVSRDGAATLGAQVEDQLRCAIRDGAVKPGARVPSTRDLARQLGVSRRVVVDAYGQLAAEGYLSLRQGARPRVSATAAAGGGQGARPRLSEATAAGGGGQGARPRLSEAAAAPGGGALAAPQTAPPPPRFDFRPSVPDVSTFPRAAWLRATREALAKMPDADLQYGDPAGVDALRSALADYLGRVRGVVAEPARVVVTTGYTQSLALACHALAAAGAQRIALEDPTNPEQHQIARRAGLEPVPIPVDADGLRIDALERARPDAVVVTPAHQHPTGAVLSGERRTALLGWLRERDAVAIEDDYDAEYRYDRAAVGALQGLEPDRVAYAGSASKTLAPALRLGWLVIPPRLLARIREEKLAADLGTARIEQHAFARFLARGELDRHLRRMRAHYRGRRDALVDALAEELPEATVRGVAAGLHVTVALPGGDERAIAAEAAHRRIALNTMRDYRDDAQSGPAVLMLGYGQTTEAAIPAGVRELAAAVRAAAGIDD